MQVKIQLLKLVDLRIKKENYGVGDLVIVISWDWVMKLNVHHHVNYLVLVGMLLILKLVAMVQLGVSQKLIIRCT